MTPSSTAAPAPCRHSTALRRGLCTLFAGIALGVSGAQAGTVFFEDFEGYEAGSNLLGQGGWVGAMAPVLVNDAPFWAANGSRVLDGLTVGHLGNSYGMALHPFTAPGERYTVSFDAKAFNTMNTWGGLSSLDEGSATHVATGAFWVYSTGWHLLVRDAGVLRHDVRVDAGIDHVHLSITVDPLTLQVVGAIADGWPGETPPLAVSQHFVDVIDGVNFGIDYRNLPPRTPGLQIDNVRVATVSAVPEGGTRGLLLAGTALLLACQCRRRQPRS